MQETHYGNVAALVLGKINGNIMTQQGIDALTRLVQRHMLFSHMQCPGVPIARNQLSSLVSENAATATLKPNVVAYIIALAQKKMIECFGMEMVEVTKQSSTNIQNRSGAQGKGSVSYVLRSLVPTSLFEAVVDDGKEGASQGFLATIMGLLHIAGGSMTQEDLWRHLQDVGVVQSRHHPVLGMPDALVEVFVRRKQLNVHRRAGSDGPEVMYSIGEAVLSDVAAEKLKTFVETEMEVGQGDGPLTT